jgi:hypothetical protein
MPPRYISVNPFLPAKPEEKYFHRREAEFAEIRQILFPVRRRKQNKSCPLAVYIFLRPLRLRGEPLKVIQKMKGAKSVPAPGYAFSAA